MNDTLMASESSWRKELETEKGQVLKIEPGQKVCLTFIDEGKKWNHDGYKEAIVFGVQLEGETEITRWCVRSKNLLWQINRLGPVLKGMKVELFREGKGLETRYMLRKVE